MDPTVSDLGSLRRSPLLRTSNCCSQALYADGIAEVGSRRAREGVAYRVLMLEEMPLRVWLLAIFVEIRSIGGRLSSAPQRHGGRCVWIDGLLFSERCRVCQRR